MNKKQLLIGILALSLSRAGYSQVNTSPVPDPAELPSVYMQGNSNGSNYSIDMFTGIAGMTVPIYNYSVDGLDLGIYLGYNAKGVLVDQMSSSVGLNFDLATGGYIERIVNDIPDETDVASSPLEILGILNSPSGYPSYTKESEYDDFTAVFCGRQVNFVLNGYDSSQIVTAPKSELDINAVKLGAMGSDTARQMYFTIKDEKGNLFEFHKGDIQYTYIGAPDDATDKWMLTKITTYSGKVITYTYSYYGPSTSYYDYDNEQVEENTTTTPYSVDSLHYSKHFWGGLLSHVSSIQYPDGTTVNFQMENVAGRMDMPGTKALKSITITKGYSDDVADSLKYIFNYAYFNAPITTSASDTVFSKSEVPYMIASNPASTNSTYIGLLESDGMTLDSASNQMVLGLRLKLKSIYKVGADGITSQLYDSFIYNTTPLPQRLSPSQDWYGYYNNQTPLPLQAGGYTFYLSVPKHQYYDSATGTASYYGVDKTPNITYMQAGILTGIYNGLGGETDFYYKAHTLSDIPVANLLHTNPSDFEMTETYDGLCIDKIVKRDGYNTDDNDTTYYNFQAGFRFFQGGYFWYPDYYVYKPTPTANEYKRRIYTNKPVSPFDFFNNSNHGYSYATVTKTGYKGEMLSKTVYHFSNIADGSKEYLDDDKTCNLYHFFPRTDMRQYKLGLLLDKRYYGNADTPVSKIVYQYDTSVGNTVTQSIRTFGFTYDSNYYDAVTGLYETARVPSSVARYYNPLTAKMTRLTKTTTTMYAGNDSIVQAVNDQYDSYDNLITSTWTDSKNNTFTKNFFYTYNYYSTWPQFQIGDNLVKYTGSTDSVISYNLMRPVLSGDTMRFPSLFTSFVSGKFANGQVDSQRAIYHDTTYEVGPVYLGTVPLIPLAKASEVLLYDDHGNPLYTANCISRINSSAIWDTRIGQKIADVTNASYSQIAYTSFEGGTNSAMKPFGTFDYNKGNWDYDPGWAWTSSGPVDKPVTGHDYFRLEYAGNPLDSIISVNPLTAGQQYIVSFWAWLGKPGVYQGAATGTPLTLQSIVTVGNWTLYVAYVTGNGSRITIAGDAAVHQTDIDELRLYPANASMTTYTYEPLFGISSICDARNNITYLEYDVMGRPSVTRDINGNIISFTRHTIQGSDN